MNSWLLITAFGPKHVVTHPHTAAESQQELGVQCLDWSHDRWKLADGEVAAMAVILSDYFLDFITANYFPVFFLALTWNKCQAYVPETEIHLLHGSNPGRSEHERHGCH